METIFTYLLNASAGISLFYIAYWLFLRKEIFHLANRCFLVAALIAAILLPLFPLQYSVFVEPQNTTRAFQTISNTFKNIPVVTQSETLANSFNWQHVLGVVYTTGAIIFLLRLLIQASVLLHLILKNRIKLIYNMRIVENEKYGLPFSFFNIVFINPRFHIQNELPEILAHEKVHIRENHWFDLLFIELLTVIFWFNPFIWFFERSIKQNHEYLADKGVLAQGHTVARYQAILVNQLMGMQIIGVTNNLNFALNANRLKMMTKKKTSNKRWIRFIWVIPVVALLLFAFAEPKYGYKNPIITDNDLSIQVVKGEKELSIHGKVIHKETKETLHGASVMIKGTSIGTVVDKDGTFNLVDPNPEVDANGTLTTTVVVSFVGLKTIVKKISSSSSAIQNAKCTFQMEDEIIYTSACFNMPSPPTSPSPPKTVEKTKQHKSEKEEMVFVVVEDMPQFPGSSKALTKFVQSKTKKYDLTGKAKIGFTVNPQGKVINTKVVEKDNDKLGRAAAEIIAQSPLWTPGKQRGKAVPVKYLIDVEFE
ncbi:carboxypeptidase-like regulatory domain-containing protein [Labilibaculum sp.]|uniref:carboxypeptidase-like regulatory domain-containing protein n=1 Tax=Labilibaculum sp. TaxID=2060723 RepID=UPI003568BF42